jgi:Ca-activated chloride channel homolog
MMMRMNAELPGAARRHWANAAKHAVRIWRGAMLSLAGAMTCAVAAQSPVPGTAVAPLMLAPAAEQPVRLEALSVRVQARAGYAQTEVELRFVNPNGRVLEGELNFPLSPGQRIEGFALDVQGRLRDAVAVDKPRAEQIFEDITRRNVDPGLLTQTRGNFYKLRVYPLPPKGSRTVRLRIGEEIDTQLPLTLAYAPEVAQFRLSLDLEAAQPPADLAGLPMQWRTQGDRLLGEYEAQNLRLPPRPLRLALSGVGALAKPLVQVQDLGRERYAMARLRLPLAPEAQRADANLPRRLLLVWDRSWSARHRDLDAELRLLDALFRKAAATDITMDVRLVQVAERAWAPQGFRIRSGDWSALRAALRKAVPDGGTALNAVQPDGWAEQALWFTDGNSTLGSEWPARFGVRSHVVLSAAGANRAALGALARRTGGVVIDLLAQPDADAALAEWVRPAARVRSLTALDIGSPVMQPGAGGLITLAGVVQGPNPRFVLTLDLGNGTLVQREISVPAHSPSAEGLAERWASMQITELELTPVSRREDILALAKRFARLLEAPDDYVRYGVPAPAELRETVERLSAARSGPAQTDDRARMDALVRRFAEWVQWWNTPFPKDPPVAKRPSELQDTPRIAAVESPVPVPQVANMALAAPAPATAAAAPARERAAARQFTQSADRAQGADGARAAGEGVRIQLKPADPQAPYLQALRAAAPAAREQLYLKLRDQQADSVSFFFDVSDFLREQGDTVLADRVLSNVAELDLENRQLLRLLAYRLQLAKRLDWAVPLFERVRVLAPHEPQSHRDLALGLGELGQRQRAAELLYHVATQRWDARFVDIDLIALTEMNALAAQARAAGKPLDLRAVPPALLHNLTLDLRVALAWDADNTDVDLHVIDPSGEEVFFGQPLSSQGGRISRDATGGYGPEVFMLRKAKPGRYRVEANFYGHRQQLLARQTGLMLRLSTGFGTARQTDASVVRWVGSQSGQRVVIGTFDVQP